MCIAIASQLSKIHNFLTFFLQLVTILTSAVVKRLTVRYPTAHGRFRFQLDGLVFPFF